MTKQIRISDDLSFPLDIVTQAVGVLAKRRAGKSYFLRRLFEQLFRAGQQVAILDPKGDWWGIRSAADGRAEGLPIVILGGDHGDVPLEVGSGEAVAKMVVEDQLSALLDLSLFRKHELATFSAAFLENLYRLKAREQYRTPLMLGVDEADAIAPQQPMRGEERMLGAIEDIVRCGGQRGIGCAMATQRSAVLNKNVLTQIQVLVALRTIAPQDLKAMDAWIDVHGTKEERGTLMESLPAVPVGDAWVWSPGWPTSDGIFQRIHTAPIETFDSGATPKPGQHHREPKKIAEVNLDALRRQMAATIERAKENDPKELKKQIAELHKQVLARPTTAPKESDLVHLKAAAMREARNEWKGRVAKIEEARRGDIARYNRLRKMFTKLTAAVSEFAKELAVDLPAMVEMPKESTADVIHNRPSQTIVSASQQAPTPSCNGDGSAEGVSGVQRKILNALAELEQLGARSPVRELVAMLAGYTNLKSAGFVKAVSSLRTDGHISYPNVDTMALTESGRSLADFSNAPRSPEDVQNRICALVGGASERILRPLIRSYPQPLPRSEVANEAGYGNLKSAGFVKAISRLRSLGFVDYPDTQSMVAQPVLFLEAQ